ncbi:MAG: hypothetical protein ACRDTR_13480 [Rubrobacter sp.]
MGTFAELSRPLQLTTAFFFVLGGMTELVPIAQTIFAGLLRIGYFVALVSLVTILAAALFTGLV